MSMSVFYYLFTGFKPSAYDFGLMSTRTGLNTVASEQADITGKAETVLALYCNPGTSAKENRNEIVPASMTTQSNVNGMFDIPWGTVNPPENISTHGTRQLTNGRVFIVKYANQEMRKVLR
jgi:hypothetical protein